MSGAQVAAHRMARFLAVTPEQLIESIAYVP